MQQLLFLEQYLICAQHVVVDAPEVLHRLEAVHDLDAALVRLARVLALLLRALAVVPEAVPILASGRAPGVCTGDRYSCGVLAPAARAWTQQDKEPYLLFGLQISLSCVGSKLHK